MTAVIWEATTVEHPARTAALASMGAVSRKDKAGWLELFAADGVVEDPVGKSPFDPDGVGHHGHEGISAFWDKAIAAVERFEFRIADSFAAGDEVAKHRHHHGVSARWHADRHRWSVRLSRRR